MHPIRVLLADDHPVILIGSKQILARHAGIAVVGAASSTDMLLMRISDTPCDVLVTDYLMPGGIQADGDALLRKLRRIKDDLPIVVLTMTSSLAVLSGMLDAGVMGIVDKTADIHEIPAAIRSAKEKRQYLSSQLKQRFCGADISLTHPIGLSSLSPSELRVAHMFSQGLSITDIAAQLNKAVSTVSRQKNTAMDKLGIDNNIDLIDFVRGNK